MMTMSFKRRPLRILQWQGRSALLFLGFGGVFLVLGYYFPTLWKPTAEEAEGTA